MWHKSLAKLKKYEIIMAFPVAGEKKEAMRFEKIRQGGVVFLSAIEDDGGGIRGAHQERGVYVSCVEGGCRADGGVFGRGDLAGEAVFGASANCREGLGKNVGEGKVFVGDPIFQAAQEVEGVY